MTRAGTIWENVLRILGDGKRHRAAEMGDCIGCQPNSIERQIHDLRHGLKPGGAVDIKSTLVPGKAYSEYWIARATVAADPLVEQCRRIMAGYPADHRQRKEIKRQINSIQRRTE